MNKNLKFYLSLSFIKLFIIAITAIYVPLKINAIKDATNVTTTDIELYIVFIIVVGTLTLIYLMSYITGIIVAKMIDKETKNTNLFLFSIICLIPILPIVKAIKIKHSL